MEEMTPVDEPDDRAVWRSEVLATSAALGVLALAFIACVGLQRLLPEGWQWAARMVTAAPGFWYAVRAYRHVLRSRGFEPRGLGVPLRGD